jgi:hypothetical protein
MDRGTQKVAPGFSDYIDAFREVISLWRQWALRVYSVLPFGFVLAAFRSLYREGWLVFPVVWGILMILLALSFTWYRASKKARRPALLAGIFICAVFVICFRTDWIVLTRYDFMGRESFDFYLPPQSPFWLEPRPEQLLPGAKAWEVYRFFDFGKDWTPVREPWLEVSWLAVTFRLMAYTIIPYVGLSGVLRLAPNLAKRPNRIDRMTSSHG